MEREIAKLKSQPSPLRSAGTMDNGNPVFRGLGVVFGGRDLYGDTFSQPRQKLAGDDPELKLGTEYYLSEIADSIDWETGEVKGAFEIPVFWDHGLGVLGSKRLGKAVLTKITEEGLEYLIEIELERAKEYQELIDITYDYKMLGLSSQTLPSFASFDWSTFEIKGWLPAEMTLTVVPAEHRTRDTLERVRSLFRKHGVEIMPEEIVTQEENIPAEDENTISDSVDELFDSLAEEISEEEETVMGNEALSYVLTVMEDVQAELRAIREELARAASAEDIAAIRDELAETREEYVEAARTMTARLTEILVPAVRTSAAHMVQQSSDFELQALRGAQQQNAPTAQATRATRSIYNLPVNAPGQN